MSETMTPMQRVLTALSHKEPDRVPFFFFLTMHGAKELGMSIEQYYSRAENVVEGQLRLREKFGHDCYYVFQYAALELEPWGGEVDFTADCAPQCAQPVITDPRQILDLQAPDPLSSPAVGRVLESIRLLKEKAKGDVPILGTIIAPFSLPVMQMGFDKYIELIYEQPDLFNRLMSVNEEFCVRWANAQFAAGATAVGYFDPVASTVITSPALSRKTGFPIARRTIPRIQGPVALHFAAGPCLPLLDELMGVGMPMLGVSLLGELAELKKACRGKLSLMGTLNAIEMRRWTIGEAREETKRNLAAAAAGGGFVLSENYGEIPYQVPDEVLSSVAETVRVWGRYPLNW